MMTLKKTLAQRLFGVSGISRRVVTGGCRGGSHARSDASWSRRSIENDPGQNAPFHRFLHRIPWLMPELRPIPPGDGLMERLVDRHLPTGRVNMDGMIPSPPPDGARGDESPMLTAQDARKLSRAAQMEAATARLREVREICIPYPEFVRVCGEGCPDPGQGAEIAKLIDESGYVVVFGDIVLLQPDMVVEAMVGLMPAADDRRRKELEELERQKTAIDRQAEAQVRRELSAGLGFVVAQTAAFMRLTFWELSWDVMEPICFYVTSFYFMLGYVFFLRTSREPSFEGFFQSRFLVKQKRLIRSHGFDTERYEQLRDDFHHDETSIRG